MDSEQQNTLLKYRVVQQLLTRMRIPLPVGRKCETSLRPWDTYTFVPVGCKS